MTQVEPQIKQGSSKLKAEIINTGDNTSGVPVPSHLTLINESKESTLEDLLRTATAKKKPVRDIRPADLPKIDM